MAFNRLRIDGHNRYEICRKHGIDFIASEEEFNSRTDARNWIIDNQLNRRNISGEQRTYLIGKRYKEEKQAEGRQTGSLFDKKLANSLPVNDDESTAHKIAKQSNVSHQTVKNAEKFVEAVDKVSENTGINPQKILSGEINASRKDIQTVVKYEPSIQKRVFKKIENRLYF
jgi:hypothetical protein